MRKESENKQEFDDDLLNFSPNDNGELIIEGEEIEQTVSTVSQQETTNAVLENDFAEKEDLKNEITEETVENETVEESSEPVSLENNTSVFEDEQSEEIDDEDTNQIEDEMEKKRAKGVIILLTVVIILLLLLLGGGIWFYFSKIKPVLEAPKEVVIVHDTIIAEPVAEPIPEIVEDTVSVVDTVVPAPKVYVEQRIAGKNKVPTAGWLIGYKATPNEVEAIKMVAEISYVDSIPCGYYWINDARKGKKLFKVYVGPYKTQEEVEAVFPMIKARVADAHIYSEDAELLEIYRQQKQVYTAEVQ
ncbi:MAG: hypothetical protein MJ198_09525 [Bacteroidales bacterium]|nr:hypothetical protein [Bacteroidales bacterium]